ncbi:MAG: hypothetical protein IIU36_04460 [Firmicutes bacterium]|nr:hypothetical protein [Bacillota bacterium]
MKVSEIDNMAYESLLYDFYGALLTDKQREVMELYHEENFSIVEIAKEMKVSKQAVYDNLKKSDRILRDYEEKLGLMMSLLKTREAIESAERKIDEMMASPKLTEGDPLKKDLLELRDMISGLAE